MSEQNNSRSGLQTAIDVARTGKAAARIAKAAAAAGLKVPLLRRPKKPCRC